MVLLLAPENSIEWAKKIIELPEVREEIISEANKEVTNSFSWKKSALLRQLISTNN